MISTHGEMHADAEIPEVYVVQCGHLREERSDPIELPTHECAFDEGADRLHAAPAPTRANRLRHGGFRMVHGVASALL